MRVIKDLDSFNQLSNPVLTIGTFDGVHLGHQHIINRLNEEAKKINGESVLLTFEPHPRIVLYPESHGLQLIQTQEEKLAKLERFGLQNVIIYPFTFDFSRISAVEFIRDIIVNQLNTKKLVIGYDHQFGRNREGSISFLKDVADVYSLEIIEIPAQIINDSSVSSTKIRQALTIGNIEMATAFLGDYFSITGKVISGNSVGRTLGYPTANIIINDIFKQIPSNGVYAVKITNNGNLFIGMMNIGIRPTFNLQGKSSIEVHIFDFSENIYEQEITIHFVRKIREECKFDTINALKNQLSADEKLARLILANS